MVNGTQTSHYTYDAGGNRVRKVVDKGGGLIHERIYIGDWEVYREIQSGTVQLERETLHISDDTGRIALVDTKTIESGSAIGTPVSIIRYQMSNHLGSATLELDNAAAIISYEEYHPFGSTAYRSGRNAAETSLKRYRYVGKERDDETGLYYYGARYYATWLARFVSVDPLKNKYPQLTSYQYAGNDPVGDIDIDGKQGTSSEVRENGLTVKTDALSHVGVKDKIISFELEQAKQKQQAQELANLFSSDPAKRPNAPSIGPAERKTASQIRETEKTIRGIEYEQKIQQLRQDVQATSPFVGGGGDFGFGFAETTREALVQEGYIIATEYAIVKTIQGFKYLKNLKSAGKVTDEVAAVSSEAATTTARVEPFSEISISAPEAILGAEEASFVNKLVSSQIPPNYGVFLNKPLSTDALRVLSGELGGAEVAQIFVKGTGGSGYYNLIYGSPGRIVLPKFTDGTPYLISHVHPSGNPIPSISDIELLKDLQQIQRSAGQPVQQSSQIIPIGSQNVKFNINSSTRGF